VRVQRGQVAPYPAGLGIGGWDNFEFKIELACAFCSVPALYALNSGFFSPATTYRCNRQSAVGSPRRADAPPF